MSKIAALLCWWFMWQQITPVGIPYSKNDYGVQYVAAFASKERCDAAHQDGNSVKQFGDIQMFNRVWCLPQGIHPRDTEQQKHN